VRLASALKLPFWTIQCNSQTRGFRRPLVTCLACRGSCLSDQRRPRHFTEEQPSRAQAKWAESVRRSSAIACKTPSKSDARLQLLARTRQNRSCRCSRADGRTLEPTLTNGRSPASKNAMLALYPISQRAPNTCRVTTASGSSSKSTPSCRWSPPFPVTSLIGADFINWAMVTASVGSPDAYPARLAVAYVARHHRSDRCPTACFRALLNPKRVVEADLRFGFFCQELPRPAVIDYVGAINTSTLPYRRDPYFRPMAAKAVWCVNVGRAASWNGQRPSLPDELRSTFRFQPAS